jgi:hypothetical protein
MYSNLLDSRYHILQNSENENKDKFISFFYMHAKLLKFDMHIPHVVLDLLTKWHIQILLLLAVVPFLSSAMLEFWSSIPACLRLNFGYVSPHDISNVQKIFIKFCLHELGQIIFNLL